MKQITPQMILDLNPCYHSEDIEAFFNGRESVSVADILNFKKVKKADRLWVLLGLNLLSVDRLVALYCKVIDLSLPRWQKLCTENKVLSEEHIKELTQIYSNLVSSWVTDDLKNDSVCLDDCGNQAYRIYLLVDCDNKHDHVPYMVACFAKDLIHIAEKNTDYEVNRIVSDAPANIVSHIWKTYNELLAEQIKEEEPNEN